MTEVGWQEEGWTSVCLSVLLLQHHKNICIRQNREGDLSGFKGSWPSQRQGQTSPAVGRSCAICPFLKVAKTALVALAFLPSSRRTTRSSRRISPLTSSTRSRRRSALAPTSRSSSRRCESPSWRPPALLRVTSSLFSPLKLLEVENRKRLQPSELNRRRRLRCCPEVWAALPLKWSGQSVFLRLLH